MSEEDISLDIKRNVTIITKDLDSFNFNNLVTFDRVTNILKAFFNCVKNYKFSFIKKGFMKIALKYLFFVC